MTTPRPDALGLVVPVFDEAERLADYGKPLVDFIARQPPGSELVFVDDGSTDGTLLRLDELVAAAPSAPVRVLRRPHLGKGATVAAGLHTLTTPLVGFCDVDLSTPLEELERIVSAAARAHALAIGSRDLTTSHLVRPEGPIREALGRGYNRLLQATVTPGVVDTQCGAKVAPRDVWARLLPHCREVGFAWDAELIAVAQALGVAVVEVPIDWRHDERSKINVGRDGIAMVLATPRIWRRARRAAATAVAASPPVAVAAPSATAAERREVFDDENATILAGSDRSHWWFRSKAAFVATALRRTAAPRPERGWLVDLGGGAGGVTALLGWPPDRVAVLEGNAALARQARAVHGLAAARSTVDRVPLASGTAEVVCLLDVIEHLHDPLGALREAARLLPPGGRLVVNVPAHPWLWSAADEQLGHVRRYTRRALRAELASAGFTPVVLTHVFSWLVPPVWFRRKVVSGGSAELGLDQTSWAIDRAAMVLTALERSAIGRASLPFGTSILCVATRRP
ncbi:MAG TPA: bifunctional glycosyltransferase/class I SAM-dependent methyltransferase [Acidimicrobiia bacterium]|nr:bifunctional glycosyltransferase/class I SAM-dependent methyltransferase [Acidimicrobiia bacterium]